MKKSIPCLTGRPCTLAFVSASFASFSTTLSSRLASLHRPGPYIHSDLSLLPIRQSAASVSRISRWSIPTTLQAQPIYPASTTESSCQREPTASSCLLPDPTSLRWPCIRRTTHRQWRHRRSRRPSCSRIQHNKTSHKMRRSHCSKSIIVSHS